jgi:hypothetical protein
MFDYVKNLWPVQFIADSAKDLIQEAVYRVWLRISIASTRFAIMR